MATKKIPFRTMLDDPIETVTPSGEREEDVWALRINEAGEEEFYISGRTNIWEKIQAFEPECNIDNILTKMAATGDANILMQRKAEYMDITEMPNNIMDAHRMITDAERKFNELPLNIRKEYDFNFSKYLKDVGSENWMKTMGFTKDETIEIPLEKEEKEVE